MCVYRFIVIIYLISFSLVFDLIVLQFQTVLFRLLCNGVVFILLANLLLIYESDHLLLQSFLLEFESFYLLSV